MTEKQEKIKTMTEQQQQIKFLVHYIDFMGWENLVFLGSPLRASPQTASFPIRQIRESAEIIQVLAGAYEYHLPDNSDERIGEFIAQAKKRMEQKQ